MEILLTNDDGIQAPGLAALRDELTSLGRVTVVAPDRQRSGVGCSITLYDPLLVRRSDHDGIVQHAVSGTPADAVKLAVYELIRPRPELVVSGINFGLNTGSNVLYSGTVAAALEGALLGIPSFAISVEAKGGVEFPTVARAAAKLVRRLLPSAEPGVVFNINFPAKRPRGVMAARQEETPYSEAFDRRKDPRGRTYFWIHGTPEANYRPARLNGAVPTDAWVVANGYVSVTPLRRVLTDPQRLESLRRRLKGKK